MIKLQELASVCPHCYSSIHLRTLRVIVSVILTFLFIGGAAGNWSNADASDIGAHSNPSYSDIDGEFDRVGWVPSVILLQQSTCEDKFRRLEAQIFLSQEEAPQSALSLILSSGNFSRAP